MSRPSGLSANQRALVSPPSALPPLSFDDGDVILCAEDAKFKVHIWLLRLSSPFFKTMSILPQPGLEIPVIRMREEVASLDFVLRSIYPVERPVIASIEHAQKLFEVAQRLNVERALQLLRASLTQFVITEPDALRAWAIAVRYGLKEAEQATAQRFERPWISSPPQELEHVSALKYFNLLQEYEKRSRR